MFLEIHQTKYDVFHLLLMCFAIQFGSQISPRKGSLVCLKHYLNRALKFSIVITLSIDTNERLGQP